MSEGIPYSAPKARIATQVAVSEDGEGSATIAVLSNDGKVFLSIWNASGFGPWRRHRGSSLQ